MTTLCLAVLKYVFESRIRKWDHLHKWLNYSIRLIKFVSVSLLVLFTNVIGIHFICIFILYGRFWTLYGLVLISVKAWWNLQPEGFSLQKNVLWKSTLEFFSAKIHSTERFVFLLPPSALVLLFKKSKYLWFSSGQFKETECIVFCYLSVSIKLLLSAENEVGCSLLSAWFPWSHWFSVMIPLSFSVFWSDMKVSISVILSGWDVTLIDLQIYVLMAPFSITVINSLGFF